ncbi:MAG: Flp pilus assembly complex ATPase component TadA [Candidatus Omnitrophica bacterium]|nr:Flp pilus assembly complex ATPase component TadA [Candidatus Omnitrophota bacterium]
MQTSYLGQLLVNKKIITPEQSAAALNKQKSTGQLLGVVLLELGFVDEQKVFFPILAEQCGIPYLDLNNFIIPRGVIEKIPAKLALHYKIIPVSLDKNHLVIATADPLNIQILDEIAAEADCPIKAVLSTEKDILEAIRKFYGVGAETIEKMMGSAQPTKQPEQLVSRLDDPGSEATISRFLNQILMEAYQSRATDIHIEPYEDELKIRYRIDGVLHNAKIPQDIKHFKDSIVSRIKVLSNLNIAERRTPQDGRFKVRAENIDLDLRVSFLPTQFGEGLVLRILNTAKLYSLEDLGLRPDEKTILETLIKKQHGIIFLTGPTGSGKTTTLYSCLSKINTEDHKILTIEDPIEYQLKGIMQIQINPGVGLTFAKGLRSMLRHDPDIMMIGEVRDTETAQIAVQIALTGHLVFSTLHTNDAASGVARLLDMGVEPYLITSTVECFIAQRLIRVICPHCKQISKEPLEGFKDQAEGKPVIIYEGKGCEKCSHTGFFGRQAIYEFLLIDDHIRKLVLERTSAERIREAAIINGMKTLLHSGWEKVKAGITTPQEILRVASQDKID